MLSEDTLNKARLTLRILGLRLDCLSYTEMMDRFDEWIHGGTGRAFSVALVNVNCCVSGLLDAKVRRVYQDADMRGLDGMPFLYLARIFKKRECDRMYGPDLMLKLAEYSDKRGYRIFLYGGAPGAPEAMVEHLKKRSPKVDIAGLYSPPFRSLTVDEDEQVCKMIRDSGANVLFVGLGSPKQDVWIEEHRTKLPGTIIIAAGATFDFLAGRIQQAPAWIRSSGFEWLYRLFQDPKRLWKRYTIYNVLFFAAWGLELLGLLNLEAAGPAKSSSIESKSAGAL